MDSSTTITGGVFLLFCIILFVLINRSKKKKTRQYLLPLNSLAEKYNCKISKYDIWNNSIIGIDESKHFVFAIHEMKPNGSELVINLAEIFRCRVNELSRTSGPKEGNIKAFDRIDLVFINKDKSKADQIVVFYNANSDRLTLTGELQLAEKWCVLVNNSIAAIGK